MWSTHVSHCFIEDFNGDLSAVSTWLNVNKFSLTLAETNQVNISASRFTPEKTCARKNSRVPCSCKFLGVHGLQIGVFDSYRLC